jgi:hypothetical protein
MQPSTLRDASLGPTAFAAAQVSGLYFKRRNPRRWAARERPIAIVMALARGVDKSTPTPILNLEEGSGSSTPQREDAVWLADYSGAMNSPWLSLLAALHASP